MNPNPTTPATPAAPVVPGTPAAPVAATINLTKGQNVNLTKDAAPGVTKFHIGLGWNPRATAGAKFDLDAAAFLVGADGKITGLADVCWYKGKDTHNGAVVHSGDNRDGQGDGDDEKISVDLAKIPASINKVIFSVSIYGFRQRKQNFGQVDGAFIRIADLASPAKDIARYDLSEDASTVTGMIFGELYRHGSDWKFKAIGQGYEAGLKSVFGIVGVAVDEEVLDASEV